MSVEGGDAPPPGEGEFPQDRCPSCGKPLKRVEGHAESYCEAEDLYVEVVKPPAPEPARPALVRAEVLAATKRALQDLGRAYGLPVKGSKTDILTRILRYMDEHGIDLPPEEIAEKASGESTSEPIPSEPAEEPPKEAPAPPEPLATVDAFLEEIEEIATEEPPAGMEAHEAEPEPSALETEPTPGTERAGEVSAEPAGEEIVEEPGPEATAESVEEAEPVPEVEPETAPAAEEEIAEEPEVEVASEPVTEPEPAFSAARLRRDRRLFFVGILLAALGGPGLVIGSLLHDLLRVPFVGQTYEAFGPLNVLAASIGGVLLVGGLVAIGVSLRGGVLRSVRATGA